MNETRRLRGTLTAATSEEITVLVDISPSETTEVRVPLESVAARQHGLHMGRHHEGAAQDGPNRKDVGQEASQIGASDAETDGGGH